MNNNAWVIDDHQFFNAGISRLLVDLSGIDKVLSFSCPQEVFDAGALDAPRLIVADYFIPGFSVDSWIPKLKKSYARSPIVVVSSSISSLDRKHCLELGAIAYFEKHLEPETVLAGLQQVLDDRYNPDSAASAIAAKYSEGRLTPRQIEILICLARGSSLKLIAHELEVSTETVKSHLSSLYKNLKVSSKDEAIIWARKHGLV